MGSNTLLPNDPRIGLLKFIAVSWAELSCGNVLTKMVEKGNGPVVYRLLGELNNRPVKTWEAEG